MQLHSVATRPFALLVLALAVAGCATTQSPQEEVVVTQPAAVVTTEGATTAVVLPTELATIHPTYITTWTGKDPAAFRVYFTDAAVVRTPVRTYTGWEEIQTGWLTPLLPTLSGYTVTPTTFTKEGTNIIVESGNYVYKVNEAGMMKDVTGTYTYRWQLDPDGNWRLVAIDLK